MIELLQEAIMKYQVTLYPSDEGFAVCVPSLPGCWSQGATQAEAVENISIAIREYLETEEEPPNGAPAAVRSGPSGDPELSVEAEFCDVEVAD